MYVTIHLNTMHYNTLNFFSGDSSFHVYQERHEKMNTLQVLHRIRLALTLASLASSLKAGEKCTIKICHNKDCTKRGGGEQLVKTFRDLLPTPSSTNEVRVPSIESSGCL